jgi:hypothetical protein
VELAATARMGVSVPQSPMILARGGPAADTPLTSVIIPTRNRLSFLHEANTSGQSQSKVGMHRGRRRVLQRT